MKGKDVANITVKTNSNRVEIWEGDELLFSKKGNIREERLPKTKTVYGITWQEYGYSGWSHENYVVRKGFMGAEKGKWLLECYGVSGERVFDRLLDLFRAVRDDKSRV